MRVQRHTRMRIRSTRQAWPVVGMAATIAGLHLVGWLLLVGSRGTDGRTASLGIGIGLTAYTLGLRHAFDADHIAAIDNTTRRLVGERRRPLSVGFWFSLGHSSVVLALTVALALGARALVGPIEDANSTVHQVTGLIGTTVSGVFLYVIAAINLVLLARAMRQYRRVRAGVEAEHTEHDPGPAGGPLSKAFGRIMRSTRRPWQMYPLGVLFGLGFDTATEIGLLVLAATGATSGIPWYALLSLPLLFAAGMSLLDTADGVVMRFAYGWAYARPGRRTLYNLAVTAVSVAVAIVVGSIEIVSLVGRSANLRGGAWSWTSNIDLNTLGFAIVGLFVVGWISAMIVWRLRHRDAAKVASGR